MATEGKRFKVTLDVDAAPVMTLRQELKQTLVELQRMDQGSEEFTKLTQKAAELKDQMADINEQVNVFASGSKYEQAANGLGEIGSAIQNLDFDKAAARAKSFATVAKSITFGDAIKSVKDLGSTFLTLGKAILTNPLFLIAAVVGAIVVGIIKLMDKLGILKKIFEAVGGAIDYVIGLLKDLLDWLGLTSFAAEEAADRQAKAQERVAKSYEDKRNKLVKAYDQEIALAQIAGETTFDIERKKQLAIIETSRQQYRALEAQRDALRASGKLTAEQSKEINANMKALREGIEGARNEIQLINAKEVEDNNTKNAKVEADNKASYAKRIADAKQYEADRLAAQRLIRDLEIELMEQGTEKDLELNREKYKRLIEDTEKNEKLLADEKIRILAEYAELQFEAEKAILQKQDDEIQAAMDKAKADREAKEAKEREEFLKRTEEDNAKRLEQQKAFNEAQLAADQSLFDAKLGAAMGLVSALGSLAGENKKVANALFAVDKALAIAQVIVSTQREIAGYAANPTWTLLPDGGATIKAANIAAAKIRAGVSIATIAASSIAKFMGGGGGAVGGGGGGAAQPQAASVPQSTNTNLFGQGNNMNNLSASQPNQQNITVTAVVSETEITSTQNKIKGIKQMSEL
jgi:hypothetical protein